jgi:hypothetical protein
LNDKSPDKQFDRHAAGKKAREERLAAALRANLKRRKAAVQRPNEGSPAPAQPTPDSDESG